MRGASTGAPSSSTRAASRTTRRTGPFGRAETQRFFFDALAFSERPLLCANPRRLPLDAGGHRRSPGARLQSAFCFRRYKGRQSATSALEGRGWHRIAYAGNRAIVHDGEWPHASERVRALPPGTRRVILGLNVFGARVAQVNGRAPEHSAAFNKTVRLYQATARANQGGGGKLTVDALKKNKPLARLFVGLARAKAQAAADAPDAPPVEAFAAGARVRARWRTGVRAWPATVAAAHEDGTLDLRYDDGTKWDRAPPSIARPVALASQ